MPEHEKIKVIEAALAIGFSLSEAIQRALGRSLTAFASAHGFRQNEVSMCLAAYEGRVYPQIRDAICSDLEIPREYLDRLIADEARRRVA